LNISENVLDTISVYPNPTSRLLNITLPNSYITALKVYDIRGREILSQNVNGENKTQLDVSKLDSALYFISVYTIEGTVTKRFLKE